MAMAAANPHYQFVMDTCGHCCICLKRMTPIIKIDDDDTAPEEGERDLDIFSFAKICQYMETTLKDVMGQQAVAVAMPHSSSFKTSIPVLKAELEGSELKGTLCKECGQLSELFSNYFVELEGIQMKLERCLKSIQRKIKAGENNQEALEEFQSEMMGQPETQLHYRILEKLRKKTLEQRTKLIKDDDPSVTLDEVKVVGPTPCKAAPSPTDIDDEDEYAIDSFLEMKMIDSPPPTNFSTSNDNEPDPGDSDVELIEDIPNPSTSTHIPSTATATAHPKTGVTYATPSSSSSSSQSQYLEGEESSSSSFERLISRCQPSTEKIIVAPPPARRRRGSNSKTYWRKEGKGMFQCEECYKIFANPTLRKTHIESIHKGVRFTCQFCNKSFANRPNVIAHEKVAHLGVRFPCQYCGKGFTQAKSRNLHVETACPLRDAGDPLQSLE